MVDQSSEPGGGNSGSEVNQFSGGKTKIYRTLKNGWLEDPYHPCCLIFMVYVGNIYVPYMDAVEDDLFSLGTNSSSPMKFNGWKMRFPFGTQPILRGYVSFREGSSFSDVFFSRVDIRSFSGEGVHVEVGKQ